MKNIKLINRFLRIIDMIYDLHCHLDLLPSMREFAKDAKESNINILAVTTTPKAYEKEIAYFHSYENIKLRWDYIPS